MKITEQMHQYYLDEKSGAMPAFIAAAILLLLGSLLFFKFPGNALSKGMGTGFLIICLLFLVVAISSTLYNNKKISALQSLKVETEEALHQKEIQRMDKVMSVTFKYAFISMAALMIAALAIILFVKSDFWKGMGIALMVLVALAIISDSFSMQRNRLYQQNISLPINI